MFKELKTDPRKLGILCKVCGVFMKETIFIKHNGFFHIKAYHGKPVICDNPECNEKDNNG